MAGVPEYRLMGISAYFANADASGDGGMIVTSKGLSLFPGNCAKLGWDEREPMIKIERINLCRCIAVTF